MTLSNILKVAIFTPILIAFAYASVLIVYIIVPAMIVGIVGLVVYVAVQTDKDQY